MTCQIDFTAHRFTSTLYCRNLGTYVLMLRGGKQIITNN